MAVKYHGPFDLDGGVNCEPLLPTSTSTIASHLKILFQHLSKGLIPCVLHHKPFDIPAVYEPPHPPLNSRPKHKRHIRK